MLPHWMRPLKVAALGAICATPLLLAQAGSSTLKGTLKDSSGALLSGAHITLQAQHAHQMWSTVTDTNGRYQFSTLPSDNYEIHVRQNGFSTVAQEISLHGNQSIELSLTLNLATVVEQVNVTAGVEHDGIDTQQIRESSARDLGEAASDIAGVQKVRKAGIANDIAIRGLFHDNLAITFDGERLYGACTGQMDPAAYHADLSEVDHADIVKGPFDVTTQGSMGGFVKVITRPADTRGLETDINTSTGSYGYYNPSLVLKAGNENLHGLGGYSFRTSEMYRDGNGSKVSLLGSYRNGNENLQAFRTWSSWTKLAFEPASRQRGEFAYSHQQSGDVLYPYMTMDGIYDNADRLHFRYDWLPETNTVRAIHATAFADKVNHLMDNRLRTSAGSLPVSMSAQVVSFNTGGRFDMDLAKDFSFGYEGYRRYWDSKGFMTMTMMGMPMTSYSRTLPDVTEQLHGIYTTFRHAWGTRWLFTSGGRLDWAHADASKTDPALYFAYHDTSKTRVNDAGASGNAKLAWQAQPWITLSAGVGSNIRFADPQERFFHSDASMGTAWVGNPLLRHPRNTEFDLGATWKQRGYELSPLFFFSKLDNYITLYAANRLQPVSGVSSMAAQSYANVQAHQWGGELNGSAPLTHRLRTFGSFSYTRGTKVPQPEVNIHSSNLFQVPPIKTTLNLRYEERGFHAEAGTVISGRQDHVDTDELELRTAGYSIFNIKGGYRSHGLHLEAGVNNLLARQYSEFLSYARNPYTNGVRLPEPGRNFFVNLSYNFHLLEK